MGHPKLEEVELNSYWRSRQTRLTIKVSLRFELTTNNHHVKYETFIVGLTLASKIGAQEFKLQTNSQLVVFRVKGESQAKDPLIQKFVTLTNEKLVGFRSHAIMNIPRGETPGKTSYPSLRAQELMGSTTPLYRKP